MTAFVLDASVAGRWLTGAPGSDDLRALEVRAHTDGVLVPTIFRYEVVNLLVTHSRRHGADLLQQAFNALATWHIAVDMRVPLMADHAAIALESGLTAYDATYLELASRTGLPLATVDQVLARAAADLGIPVLP